MFLKSKNYFNNTSANLIVFFKHKLDFSFYDKEVYIKINAKHIKHPNHFKDNFNIVFSGGCELMEIKKVKLLFDFSFHDIINLKFNFTPIFSFLFIFKNILLQITSVYCREKSKFYFYFSLNYFIFPQKTKALNVYLGGNKSFVTKSYKSE